MPMFSKYAVISTLCWKRASEIHCEATRTFSTYLAEFLFIPFNFWLVFLMSLER